MPLSVACMYYCYILYCMLYMYEILYLFVVIIPLGMLILDTIKNITEPMTINQLDNTPKTEVQTLNSLVSFILCGVYNIH